MQEESKEEIMLKTFWGYLIKGAKDYGFGMLVLCMALYYFHQQNTLLQDQVTICNEEVKQIYKQENQKLIEAIEKLSFTLNK